MEQDDTGRETRRERERRGSATKGPKSGGSLGPPWGMIYDGWLLITMRPARIHRQISQILIQLSRLMAVGSRRRCGDLSQRGREGRGRERRPPRGGTSFQRSPLRRHKRRYRHRHHPPRRREPPRTRRRRNPLFGHRLNVSTEA